MTVCPRSFWIFTTGAAKLFVLMIQDINRIAARRSAHPAHCIEGGVVDHRQRSASAAMNPMPPKSRSRR
jgi:hypothetical protein